VSQQLIEPATSIRGAGGLLNSSFQLTHYGVAANEAVSSPALLVHSIANRGYLADRSGDMVAVEQIVSH
jgi:hypothetical protein